MNFLSLDRNVILKINRKKIMIEHNNYNIILYKFYNINNSASINISIIQYCYLDILDIGKLN